MRIAVLLLLAQGALGAFDTLWFHEFRARLPARQDSWLELRLHAARDFIYAVLFATLGWFTWGGLLAWALVVLLLAEICITLMDFVVEDRTRRVPPGERITHALMGIVYGAFLATFLPELIVWSKHQTGLSGSGHGTAGLVLTLMGIGVFLSGVRDLWASLNVSNHAMIEDDSIPL